MWIVIAGLDFHSLAVYQRVCVYTCQNACVLRKFILLQLGDVGISIMLVT